MLWKKDGIQLWMGILFLLASALILFITIFDPYDSGRFGFRVEFLIMGTLVLGFFLRAVWKILQNCSQRQLQYICFGSFFLMVFLMVYIACNVRAVSKEDLHYIHEQAVYILQNGVAKENFYFHQYTNNNFITIILAWAFMAGRAIGITDYRTIGITLNIISIVIAIILGYFLVQRCFSKKWAAFYMVLNLLNPMTYAFVPTYYTDTLVLPYLLGALYCYVRSCQEKLRWIEKVLLFLTGVLCLFGYKMRGSVFVFAVAIVFYEILSHKKQAYLFRIAIILIGLLLGSMCYGKVEKHYFQFDGDKTSYPVTHWIMMGLQNEGGYSREDEEYTKTYPTKQEKVQANMVIIQKRLKDLGVKGYAKLLYNKVRRVWGVGTHRTEQMLEQVETITPLYSLFVGYRAKAFAYYAHCFYIVLWIGCLLSGWIFVTGKQNRQMFLLMIGILGAFGFYLLWETQPRYSFCFGLVLLILSQPGIAGTMSERVDRNVDRWIIPVTCLLAILAAREFTMVSYDTVDYCVRQDLSKNTVTNNYLLEPGVMICQSFLADRKFDQITLALVASNEEEQECTVELCSQEGISLYTWDVRSSDIDSKGKVVLKLDIDMPAEKDIYILRIYSKEESPGIPMAIKATTIENYEVYPHGAMSINGKVTENDLVFSVGRQRSAVIMSKTGYGVIWSLVIALELLLIKKKREKSNKELQRDKENCGSPA